MSVGAGLLTICKIAIDTIIIIIIFIVTQREICCVVPFNLHLLSFPLQKKGRVGWKHPHTLLSLHNFPPLYKTLSPL